MSAPLYRRMPGTTVSVVKAYAATFDFAFVNLFRIVDLPTLGRPMRTTVASPPFLISKAEPPPPLEVDASSSALSRASFALRRPIWCSVCLLIWVLFISSSICLIFSGRPTTSSLSHLSHCSEDVVNLALGRKTRHDRLN